MILSTARAGWQTTLADLALILFMVTAAAMAEQPDAADPVEAGSPVPPRGEPLAIYRAAPGAPPLADWLAEQPRDARQNLTIIAHYVAGGNAEAAAAAVALASEAGAAGHSARIVVEPAQASELIAVLDFDGRASGTGIAETSARPAPRAPQESDIGR
jgi:hypothetical protein